MSFGDILYRLRVERKVYQKELAIYLHVTVGTISNYENDVHSPDPTTLCKIADFFGVSIDYLLGRTDFRYPVDEIDKRMIGRYTVAEILNTVVELTEESQTDLIKYLELLNMKDKADIPPQLPVTEKRQGLQPEEE